MKKAQILESLTRTLSKFTVDELKDFLKTAEGKLRYKERKSDVTKAIQKYNKFLNTKEVWSTVSPKASAQRELEAAGVPNCVFRRLTQLRHDKIIWVSAEILREMFDIPLIDLYMDYEFIPERQELKKTTSFDRQMESQKALANWYAGRGIL